MAREAKSVPFGYEPEPEGKKGTLFVFGTFEEYDEEQLEAMIRLCEERGFTKLVLYPQTEETLRRMGIASTIPYSKRIKAVEEVIHGKQYPLSVTVDTWEGKRKKYTPVETSLGFLMEKYKGPYFVFLPGGYANKVAGYSSFEEWIRKARLLIERNGEPLHPRLEQYRSRWEEWNGRETH
ncbi:hypothetical protein N6H14_16790 [Paenibacillus sp. CC-CFT747]|nr:hypothetical protein N6H14_16790 [Paenibacillus sp. CC-CFT747]